MVDLDDTRRCPTASRCTTCLTPIRSTLRVVTANTPLGVACLTLCTECITDGVPPRWTVPTANLAVLNHCTHLGIDPDQAAALRRRGRSGCGGAR